jgi:hypothetical protein
MPKIKSPIDFDALPPEGKEAYLEYAAASPAERRAVIHGTVEAPCEHPMVDGGYCLDCGVYVPLEGF